MVNGDRFHAETALPPIQMQQLPPAANPALEGLF